MSTAQIEEETTAEEIEEEEDEEDEEEDEDEEDEETEETLSGLEKKEEETLLETITLRLARDSLEHIKFGADTNDHEVMSNELGSSINSLSLRAHAIYTALFSVNEIDGIPDKEPETEFMKRMVMAIIDARNLIFSYRLRFVQDMLNLRGLGRRPWEETRAQIHGVDGFILGRWNYEMASPSLFIGRYVRLPFPVENPSRNEQRHEMLWVKVNKRLSAQDQIGRDELSGEIVSTSKRAPFKKGDIVSFQRHEIIDVYDIAGELGPARKSTCNSTVGAQYIKTWYTKRNIKKSEEECLKIWRALTDRERIHMEMFAEYIMEANERKKRAG